MIWHYFPIGMRFPVRDFSDATKRRCWEIALSAIFSADPRGTGLYEACEAFDPGAGMPVYTCIVCYEGVKQSRAAGKRFHALDALTSRLTLHEPFVQANYLESFGPYPLIGSIDDCGAITGTDAAPFLPTDRPEPMREAHGLSILIAADGPDGTAETVLRTLGAAAADHGCFVTRKAIADGGPGTVRALVSNRKGRYETVAVPDENGERVFETIGILPGGIAVLEAAHGAKRFVGLIQKTLDLGYRNILLAPGDPDPAEFEMLGDGDPDPRMSQCVFTVLCGADAAKTPVLRQFGASVQNGAETVLDLIGFDAAAARADFVILASNAANVTPDSAAGAALLRLRAERKPTVLLGGSAADAERLRSEHPQLRGVIALSGATSEEALFDAFSESILPMLGESVAKNGTV